MLRYRIEAREAISGLERTKGKLKNSLFAALVRSTALVREVVMENIKTGQTKNLGWPPFAPSTLARKSRLGRSLSGLVDKAHMLTSIHESVSKRKLEGEVYPGVNYLIHHERGTRRMPERHIFEPVPDQVNRKVMGIFKSEVARAM